MSYYKEVIVNLTTEPSPDFTSLPILLALFILSAFPLSIPDLIEEGKAHCIVGLIASGLIAELFHLYRGGKKERKTKETDTSSPVSGLNTSPVSRLNLLVSGLNPFPTNSCWNECASKDFYAFRKESL